MRFEQVRRNIALVICLGVASFITVAGEQDVASAVTNACDGKPLAASDDPAIRVVTEAAVTWLSSLDETLVDQLRYCLGDTEMASWTNVPGKRSGGIQFRDMTVSQQRLAWNLLSTLLSKEGFFKARLIATDITAIAGATPEGSHTLVLFGDPVNDGAWGLQVDGHHLALNFLIQNSAIVLAPAFLGTQPRSVNGKFPLKTEASLGRKLIATLGDEERLAAKQDALIGRDVIVGSGRGQRDRGIDFDVTSFDGIGVRIGSLSTGSEVVVQTIMAAYVNNLATPFSNRVLNVIGATTDDGYVVYDERGSEIYYRIYVPNRLLIEYNDVSHDHVHTILRLLGDDVYSDYGAFANVDLGPRTIAEHYHLAAHHRDEPR